MHEALGSIDNAELNVTVPAYNHSTRVIEAGILKIQGPQLHRELQARMNGLHASLSQEIFF